MGKRLICTLFVFILLTALLPTGTLAAKGDSVRVVSLSPETVIRGSELTISVTIEYTLASCSSATIYVKANTADNMCYTPCAYQTVDRGSGTLVLTASLTTASEWETELLVMLVDESAGDGGNTLAELFYQLGSVADPSSGPDDRVVAQRGLRLGRVSYCYQAGGREAEVNPGVTGSYTLLFLVYGPRSVRLTCVLEPRSGMPSEETAAELIDDCVSELKERGVQSCEEEAFPLISGSGSYPLREEALGSIQYRIIVGLDENLEPVGYAVVRFRLTDEDREILELAPLEEEPVKTAPAVSSNAGKCNYMRCASPITSYLYRDGERLVRVEWIDGSLTAEYYSQDFEYLGSRTVELFAEARKDYQPSAAASDELIWGGFWHGKSGNYVIAGWDNPEDSPYVETYRVIKFDREFRFSSDENFLNCNTSVPFSSSSVRWAEDGDMLYVHSGHQMFISSDGWRHQANFLISIDTRDPLTCDGDYFTWHVMHVMQKRAFMQITFVGFVGHSFNQFILTDAEGRLVMLDHGDGNPRAAVLQRFTRSVEGWLTADAFGKVMIQEFPGAIGDNTTGASLGGLTETEGAYITAYNYNGVGANSTGKVMGVATEDPNPTRNAYLSATGKNDFTTEGTIVTKLTDYPDGGALSAGTPVLVSTGMSGGYVLWEVLEKTAYGTYAPNGHISYAKYDAGGNVGPIATVTGRLSDCQPIFTDGKVIWYVTDHSEPVFYVLDRSGLTENGISMENGGEEGPGGEEGDGGELPDDQGGGDPSLPSEIGVTVGGIPVRWTDAVPFIDDNNRTMVPLRAVGDALDLTVRWDGKAREAVFSNGTKTLSFPIGSSEARTGDGETLIMDTAAVIVNDRTYAPVRYLAEYFGYTVGWDPAARTVLIG